MVEYPEKLYLSSPDADNEHIIWFDPDDGGTEYIRADLWAALEAKLAETKGKLNEIACWSQSQGLLWWQVKAREALSALEATPPAPKVTEEMVWPDGFFTLHGDARLRDCATEGCSQHVSIRIERGGTVSDHCEPCASRIAAITAAHEADQ